jgi:3-methyladenine DNA glycosylase/8-oxoguanine DNA glycosylase
MTATTLGFSATVRLTPAQPFHFDGTFCKPSNFPTPHREHQPGRYWQTMLLAGVVYGLRAECVEAGVAQEISLTIFSDHPLDGREVDRIVEEFSQRFDLSVNLEEFSTLAGSDSILRPAEERWRGMRIGSGYSLYELLVITCVLQNTTVRRSTDMLQKLFDRYGARVLFDGKELAAFWQPEALAYDGAELDLRGLKVGYRAKTLHRVAADFAAGKINPVELRSLPRDAASKSLLDIYGVGPASVWYLLFEFLHHYDAFDTVSPWEQKIYSRLLFDSELVEQEKILAEVRRRWGNWRMLASHYVFEDLFWRHRRSSIPWLEELIRL